MKKVVLALAIFVGVAAAVKKCCPQPESEGRCGCCPDACCCMCENITATVTPVTTQIRTSATSEVCQLGPLDVSLIADSSFSIGSTGWGLFMSFTSALVGLSEWGPVGGDDTRFGLIKFGTNGELVWNIEDPQSDSVGNLQTAFGDEPYEPGFTNTIDGLNLSLIMLTDDDRPDNIYADVAFLFADGLTNEPDGFAEMLGPVSAALRAEADLLFAVAIGDKIDEIGVAELQTITGQANNDSIYYVEDFDKLEEELPALIDAIIVRICETVVFPKPTTTPTPPPVTVPIQNCKCCCPPLPDPCEGGMIKGGKYCPNAGCGCCRFDMDGHEGDDGDEGDSGRKRRR